MAGSSRQHRGEKRRKELARKARQEEKRQRKTERKASGAGSGPPIDWEAGEAGPPLQRSPESSGPSADPGVETPPGDPQDVKPS
jgi:hypothetical protein